MSDCLVLIVDDDPLVRLVLRETLLDEGYDVCEATDATEALAVVGLHEGIEVVVSDIEMPGDFNGISLSWKLTSTMPGVRVILLSGRTFPAKDELPLGVRFLRKPVEPTALLAAVRG
jgi:two-component system, response regulator PdtaR